MHVHPEASSPLDQLRARLDALERRVAALEDRPEAIAAPSEEIKTPDRVAEPATGATVDAGATFGKVLSLFGGALLGIAGAYVLRAIAGASLLPRGIVAGVAAVYATGWLLAAARSASGLAATLFGGTSILILAPMLWEMSIRFQAMSAMGAACYLTAYAAIATFLGFRPVRAAAFTMAICGAALLAVGLSIATHAMALFSAIAVALYGAIELSSLRERVRGARVPIALCADAAVWALLYVYALPPGEQGGYQPLGSAAIVGIAALLFAIQAAGVAMRVVRRAQRVDVFTVLHVMVSFALLVFAMAQFLPTHGRQGIGWLCLLLAVAGYAAGYGPVRRAGQGRNFGVFVVWSCALFYAAVFLLLTPTAASVVLGVTGFAAVASKARRRMASIEAQGAISLSTAAVASGLLGYAISALAGHMPGWPTGPVLLAAVCTVLAYAAANDGPEEPALRQILHLLLALLSALGVAALLARSLVGLAAGVVRLDVFHVAVLRTLALCIVAVALTWLGARLGRVQMIRAAYAALGLAAVKLLFEDLRHGRMEFIAGSIFLVALTLLGVPRLARHPAQQRASR